MSNVCKFCQKTFSSNASLNKHIKSAKYCLKNRSNNVEMVIIEQKKLIELLHQQIDEKQKLILLYENMINGVDNESELLRGPAV